MFILNNDYPPRFIHFHRLHDMDFFQPMISQCFLFHKANTNKMPCNFTILYFKNEVNNLKVELSAFTSNDVYGSLVCVWFCFAFFFSVY